MKMNQLQLSNMFKFLLASTKQFTKPINDVVPAARFAVWSWIENNPEEFLKVYQTKNPVINSTELYDHLRSNLKSKEKKMVFFPFMSLIAILHPANFTKAVRLGAKASDNYSTFVHKYIIKPLTQKAKDPLLPAILTCCIDLLKISTYITSGDDGVRALADLIEAKVLELIFGDAAGLPKLADGTVDDALAASLAKSIFLRDPKTRHSRMFSMCALKAQTITN